MTMSETLPPVVLLIGECNSPHFRRALIDGDSGNVLETVRNHYATSIQEAISLISHRELFPNLVVAYQSIPDECSPADIDQLIGLLPLSRFVVAFSPWCESIGRTEARWPSAWSVPASHAAARIRFELQQLDAGQQPLPATTSRDEAFAMLVARNLENAGRPGSGMSATVLSADVPLKECFENILRSVGFSKSIPNDADVWILATTLVDDDTVRRVSELRADRSEATVIVASDMVTHGQTSTLYDAGAAAVISQLRFTEDLRDCLSRQVIVREMNGYPAS
jgi:hypothetical protein